MQADVQSETNMGEHELPKILQSLTSSVSIMPGTTGRKIHLQTIKLSWDNSVMLFTAVLCVLIAKQIILQLEEDQNFKEGRFYKQSASKRATFFFVCVLFLGYVKNKYGYFYDSELQSNTL